MAQPEIDGVGVGKAAFLFGSNGAKWIAALIDALGHLQVDVVSGGYLADAATQTTLAAILARILEAPPIATTPIVAVKVGDVVPTATWTEVVAYTITAGKTLYLTDFYIACGEPNGGLEFLWDVQIGGSSKILGRCGAARSIKQRLNTPLPIVYPAKPKIWAYHWAGSNKLFHGTIIGFEV